MPWSPGAVTQSNAATNSRGYVPRIPSFRWALGPHLASVKSPRWRPAPPAAMRRPAGAGWARGFFREEHRPHISPAPLGYGQQWRPVAAPRAYFPPPRRGPAPAPQPGRRR